MTENNGSNSNTRMCHCGCGLPAIKNYNKAGRFKGYRKYLAGHYKPTAAQLNARLQRLATIRQNRAKPTFSRRIVSIYGRQYIEIKIPGEKRWVREHRYVIEQKLGRKLTRGEHVHHIDNNGLNNDLNNLQLLSASNHSIETCRQHPRPICTCTCPNCGRKVRHFMKTGETVKRQNGGYNAIQKPTTA